MMLISQYLPMPLWRKLKGSNSPLAQRTVDMVRSVRCLDIPAPRILFLPLYHVWRFGCTAIHACLRLFWWTPLFKARCSCVGQGLYLYGGLPWVAGSVLIRIGHSCRVSGKTTITGRYSEFECPQLLLGDNIDLGWQVTVAVGKKVILGNNVRVANQCFLAGYPGHPINAVDRAQHKPELEEQVRDIVLEDDVWLGTGVTVLSGVTIGEGTIVGAGSVVTKSLPAGVIAGGNPAKVIRTIGL